MGHRELGGTRWGPGGGEAWARPGVAIGPLLPWGRAPGGPCAGRGGGEGNEPTRDSRTCGRITCLPPPGPAPRVRRGPLQGGSPGPQAELVTSRGGGQSAAAAAEGAEAAAAAAAPLPARPWPSAASPRCSRTTPSRCGLSRERGGGARRRQRLGLVRSGPRVTPAASLAGPRGGAALARPRARGAGHLQPLREQRGEAGGRAAGPLPGGRGPPRDQRCLTVPLFFLQPLPPYQAPSAALPPLPAAGMPPPQAAAQPPRKASPTEPRNYGSYGTQVAGGGGGKAAAGPPRGGQGEKVGAPGPAFSLRPRPAGLGGRRHG